MKAFVAYIKFLSTGAKRGENCRRSWRRQDAGARSAPPIRCAARRSTRSTCAAAISPTAAACCAIRNLPNFGYLMPPLWGPDSFNDGAGMATLITVANFVHFNMPNGTSYTHPRLTQQECLGCRRLRDLAAAAAARRSRQGFSRSAGKAGRYSLWSLCRRLQPEAAHVRPVRPDPGGARAPEGSRRKTEAALRDRSCPRAMHALPKKKSRPGEAHEDRRPLDCFCIAMLGAVVLRLRRRADAVHQCPHLRRQERSTLSAPSNVLVNGNKIERISTAPIAAPRRHHRRSTAAAAR